MHPARTHPWKRRPHRARRMLRGRPRRSPEPPLSEIPHVAQVDATFGNPLQPCWVQLSQTHAYRTSVKTIGIEATLRHPLRLPRFLEFFNEISQQLNHISLRPVGRASPRPIEGNPFCEEFEHLGVQEVLSGESLHGCDEIHGPIFTRDESLSHLDDFSYRVHGMSNALGIMTVTMWLGLLPEKTTKDSPGSWVALTWIASRATSYFTLLAFSKM